MIRYQITNGQAHIDRTRWLETLRQDVDFIQIREPDLTARELERLVSRVIAASRPRILVNDRAGIALACGAAGVHLRGSSVTPAVIRKRAPRGFVISVACHSVEDVRNAESADYALLAPIFPPISKPDTRPPLGLPAICECAALATPVIALGGITEGNAAACIEAGAVGVAGISLFASL